MQNKEQFLALVFAGAIASDITNETSHAQLIMFIGGQIPEEKIPRNVINAAKVFLAYTSGQRGNHLYKWMLAKHPFGSPPSPTPGNIIYLTEVIQQMENAA
jgi:hypothetical protein